MVTRTTNLRSAGGARSPRFISAGALALAAAFALGVAIILLAEGSPARDPVRPDGPSSSAAAASAASATSAAKPITVYLSTSAEEAVEFQRGLATLTPGGPLSDENVLVAGTPEEAARAQEAIRALELKHGPGAVQVVDTRPTRFVPAAPGARPCDATPVDGAPTGAC